VHFYTECPVLILICAVLTALPQASWLDFGEGRRRREGRGKEMWGGGKEEKVRAGNGEGDKGKENGKQTEKEEGCGREEFCADAIFP